MGNLSCYNRRKGTSKKDEQTSPNEDVLYATIDHGEKQTTRPLSNPGDTDCDYAIVRLPCAPSDNPENNEDCADDYVLMS
ncbi:uncharacterized protein si:ch211-214p13.7 [Electrophorus electricus]|uniref:uncharacterized protein si:ch211-214p13.7 n=1 Tax=Electrophorus electricus TaxID=8005 RepID=UPI0015CFD5DE|nr:uncharacterized protein si:ch211-214p13.7 [Electrophorus electricus]